jgi:hypothetical protein
MWAAAPSRKDNAMISEQRLLELVVALNAEAGRTGPRQNNFNGVKDNYIIILDKDGNLAVGGAGLRDGVHIFRDTFGVWGMTIRPASRYGSSMRYDNPVEVVHAALAREHGLRAFYLDPAEVRLIRS